MSIDEHASRFARDHGTFELQFDASRNYTRPDDAPWTVIIDGGERAWSGFTAEDALAFADREIKSSETRRTE